MDKQVKQRWLDALRSGQYRQAQGYLRLPLPDGESGFCCLGVLCDICAKDSGEVWTEPDFEDLGYSFMGEKLRLPDRVIDWAGAAHAKRGGDLCIDYPVVVDSGTVSSLSELNDMGVSFSVIADIIEELL